MVLRTTRGAAYVDDVADEVRACGLCSSRHFPYGETFIVRTINGAEPIKLVGSLSVAADSSGEAAVVKILLLVGRHETA
jgi:hypothetical protein